jgi:ABC-type sugar transport system permease subunit
MGQFLKRHALDGLLLLPLLIYLCVLTGLPLLSCLMLSFTEGDSGLFPTLANYRLLLPIIACYYRIANSHWPSFRSDAYGAIESWQTPYFAAVQEALRLAHLKPHVPNWAEVSRALSGAFREIVYEGQPVQAALARYHRQLKQVQKRLK